MWCFNTHSSHRVLKLTASKCNGSEQLRCTRVKVITTIKSWALLLLLFMFTLFMHTLKQLSNYSSTKFNAVQNTIFIKQVHDFQLIKDVILLKHLVCWNKKYSYILPSCFSATRYIRKKSVLKIQVCIYDLFGWRKKPWWINGEFCWMWKAQNQFFKKRCTEKRWKVRYCRC